MGDFYMYKFIWLFIISLYTPPMYAQTIAGPISPITSVSLSSTSKTINFRIRWSQLQQVDSTMIAVYFSKDLLPIVYRRTKSPDTVSVTIPNDTTTYKFLLVNIRRGLASSPANVNYFFNADVYYQPVGLDLYPKDTVTVNAGGTVQFCAFMKFNDGTIALRNREASIPKCVEYYNTIPVATRTSGGAKQRAADKLCVKWVVPTGSVGTITPEVCTP
jgi:hypothetical protein